MVVCEVEVELALASRDANVHIHLRRIETRPCLDDIQSRVQSFRVRSTVFLFVVLPREPLLEPLAANRPSLAMPIDVQIHETSAIGCVEQKQVACEADEDVRLARPATADGAAHLCQGFVECCHATCPACLEPRP